MAYSVDGRPAEDRGRSPDPTQFGQLGSLEEVYHYHGIDAHSIVRAGLDVGRG